MANRLPLRKPLANLFFLAYIGNMKPEEIALLRRWFGWTLKELGGRIGAEWTNVSRMESGERNPTASQVEELTKLRAKMLREMRAMVEAAA